MTALLSIALDAIVLCDEELQIRVFSDGAVQIFGIPRDEAIGMPLEQLIPERLRARHREHVAVFARGDEEARLMGARTRPILAVRRSGEEFFAEATISKQRVDGELFFGVILRDISDRVRAEQEQRFLADLSKMLASSLEYDRIVRNVTDAAIERLADVCELDVLDEHDELVRLSVAHRDPAATSAYQALAAMTLDRSRPYLASGAINTQRSVLRTEIAERDLDTLAQGPEELALLRALEVRSLIAVPLHAQGRTTGALVFVRRGASAPYTSRDLTLAEQIAERAAIAVDNARQYQSARRAVRAREEVLAIVAHDIRNPLNAIALNAHLLARTPPQGAGESAVVVRIRAALSRANRLIQDLLDFARIDGGSLVVQQQRCVVADILASVADAESLAATERELTLEQDVSADLSDVWADPQRVAQVLENLIANAIKFTPPGGRIVVSARQDVSFVVFSVRDTGPGVSPEQLSHLFERFWQGQRSDGRGAGLGLSICKALVEAHGGRIWAESDFGRGMTVSFSLGRV